MRNLLLLLSTLMLIGSCDFADSRKVRGNGNVTTETRSVKNAHRIKLNGAIDVEIRQGPETEVKVVADDNFHQYIATEMEGDILVIRMKKRINFVSVTEMKVIITTDRLEELDLKGSGDITGLNKFTGSDRMKIRVSGIGNINMELNTPELEAEISGSGDMTLSGETRNARIKIAGIGNCNAAALKSENATVKIAGSGDVKIFAESELDISIAGIGNVYYKGAANVKQKITGSGEIKRLEE